MSLIKLYHGTNSNPVDIMDNAHMTCNINGFGFYLTNDPTVAAQYGRYVVCFEVSDEINVDFTIRPINQSYIDSIRTYRDCMKEGMEWVITDSKSMNNLILDCEDSYAV